MKKENKLRSILMVQDNPNLAKTMRTALEQAGHNVRWFSDVLRCWLPERR